MLIKEIRSEFDLRIQIVAMTSIKLMAKMLKSIKYGQNGSKIGPLN